MYSVMIVDDEPIIRKGIANFINRSSIDCIVSCEACNGLEAVEVLQVNLPDIIISDIKMPGMDGIGLSKYINDNFPNVKIILLTGYSDFEYAQSAIRYNVVDFILKPSNNNKIIHAIELAKDIIIKERLQSEKLQSMVTKLNQNISILQEKFLYDILKGIHFDQHLIQEKTKNLEIHLNQYHTLIYQFSTNDNNEIIDIKDKENNLVEEIKDFISLIFKNYTHYNITLGRKCICTIVNIEKDNSINSTALLLNKSRKLIDFFINFMNIRISLGISDMHKNVDELRKSFQESEASLSLKFYEENTIFTYSDYEPADYKLDCVKDYEYIDKILSSIKSNNLDLALTNMYNLIESLKTSHQPIEYIKNVGILISSLSFKLLITHNFKLADIIVESSKTYTDIIKTESISHLVQILELVIHTSIERLSSQSSQNNYIIKKVLRYIELNYDQPIKLNDLAELVHVNSSYLSRLIKQETGFTLTETITKIRIEKAKELLTLGNMKTYQIAIQVGIEDPAYFSQVFKKHTGISPSEYKKTR